MNRYQMLILIVIDSLKPLTDVEVDSGAEVLNDADSDADTDVETETEVETGFLIPNLLNDADNVIWHHDTRRASTWCWNRFRRRDSMQKLIGCWHRFGRWCWLRYWRWCPEVDTDSDADGPDAEPDSDVITRLRYRRWFRSLRYRRWTQTSIPIQTGTDSI